MTKTLLKVLAVRASQSIPFKIVLLPMMLRIQCWKKFLDTSLLCCTKNNAVYLSAVTNMLHMRRSVQLKMSPATHPEHNSSRTTRVQCSYYVLLTIMNKILSICLCVSDAAKPFQTHPKKILWQTFNDNN